MYLTLSGYNPPTVTVWMWLNKNLRPEAGTWLCIHWCGYVWTRLQQLICFNYYYFREWCGLRVCFLCILQQNIKYDIVIKNYYYWQFSNLLRSVFFFCGFLKFKNTKEPLNTTNPMFPKAGGGTLREYRDIFNIFFIHSSSGKKCTELQLVYFV